MECKDSIVPDENGNFPLQQYDESRVFRATPKKILLDAKEAADALKEVIESKPNADKVILNGKQYLDNGDWQLLGKFNGITSKVTETRYVEFGDVKGFEATAVAINFTGREISSAKCMCLNDEPKWKTEGEERTCRGKNGKTYKKWVEGKPLFQLMSMAETRACSKALRTVLGWIPVLAGYASTPAEEMDGISEDKNSSKQKFSDQQNSSKNINSKTSNSPPSKYDKVTHIAPTVAQLKNMAARLKKLVDLSDEFTGRALQDMIQSKLFEITKGQFKKSGDIKTQKQAEYVLSMIEAEENKKEFATDVKKKGL